MWTNFLSLEWENKQCEELWRDHLSEMLKLRLEEARKRSCFLKTVLLCLIVIVQQLFCSCFLRNARVLLVCLFLHWNSRMRISMNRAGALSFLCVLWN